MRANLDRMAKGSTELNRRIWFTLMMFAVFRLGVYVPVPGINLTKLHALVNQGALFGLINLFSGGAFFTFSVFALGVMPYINASIIMQLLTVVIPKLEDWSKEGAEGQKQITKWTRYLTAILSVIQSTGVTIGLSNSGVLLQNNVGAIALIVLSLTAGTIFLMWIGEMITERGIGNGISLVIFAGIVSGLPGGIVTLYRYLQAGTIGWFNIIGLILVGIVIIALVVLVVEAERRVPVQYPKRVVGRRIYQGQSTHIPMKINAAGVIPVIFAISILAFPITIAQFWHNSVVTNIASAIGFGTPVNIALEFILVVIFTFFYTSIVFKPDDVADNLKKSGGFIPGLRPGKPTAEHLGKVSTRITVVGALFLGLISILPTFVMQLTGIPNIFFGGTALLIVVGVALETMKQIQSLMLMRQYQGFMK